MNVEYQSDDSDHGVSIKPMPGGKGELKHGIEAKFQRRYTELEKTYERRLGALASQLHTTITQIQTDDALQYLQESALTHEFVSVRLEELIYDTFLGEREQYVKQVSEELAWSTNEKRDVEEKLDAALKKQQSMKEQWKETCWELRSMEQRIAAADHEIRERKELNQSQQEKVDVLLDERDNLRTDRERLYRQIEHLEDKLERSEQTSRKAEEQDLIIEELNTAYYEVKQELSALTQKRESEEDQNRQEQEHLQHLLHLSDQKCEELQTSLRQIQSEDYPTQVLHLKSQLNKQEEAYAVLESTKVELEEWINEHQTQAKSSLSRLERENEETTKQYQAQVNDLRDQLQYLKQESTQSMQEKVEEVHRLTYELDMKQQALEQELEAKSSLRERLQSFHSHHDKETETLTNKVTALEKELSKWKRTLQQERSKFEVTLNEKEKVFESLQEAFDRQKQEIERKRELEDLTRWQNTFATQQEAKIEALKSKYDAALQSQREELLRSQQASEKAESTSREAEMATKLRARDEDKERQAEWKRFQQQMEEREKEVREKEKRVWEQEKALELKISGKSSTLTPGMVVVNVGGEDINDDEMMDASASRHHRHRSTDYNSSQVKESMLTMSKHMAEVQARENAVTLKCQEEAKVSLQKSLQEKEKEYKSVVSSIRKSMRKLEDALTEEKKERGKKEEEAASITKELNKIKEDLETRKGKEEKMSQQVKKAEAKIISLKTEVQNMRSKCDALNEELQSAREEKMVVDSTYEKIQESLKSSKKESKMLSEEVERLSQKLEAKEKECEDEVNRVEMLKQKLESTQAALTADISQLQKSSGKELEEVKMQYELELESKRDEIANHQRHIDAMEAAAAKYEEALRANQSENQNLREKLSTMKGKYMAKEKEVTELTASRESLKQSSDKMAHEIRQEAQKAQHMVADLTIELQATQSEKRKSLRTLKKQVGSISRDWKEIRAKVSDELPSAYNLFRQDMSISIYEWQHRIEKRIQQASASTEKQVRQEGDRKTRDLQVRNQKLMERLHHESEKAQKEQRAQDKAIQEKLEQMNKLEAQLYAASTKAEEVASEIKAISQDKLMIQKERDDLQNQLTRLEDQNYKYSTEVTDWQGRLAAAKRQCVVFTQVLEVIASELNVSIPLLSFQGELGEEEFNWFIHQLNDLPSKLTERIEQVRTSAKDEGAAPTKGDMERAKATFKEFMLASSYTHDDSPWYERVYDRIQDELQSHRQRISTLECRLTEQQSEGESTKQVSEQTQETIRMLEFEKATSMREMKQQMHALEKKHERALCEAQASYKRKMNKVKHRFETDKVKAESAHETALRQLEEKLEAERDHVIMARNETVVQKLETERTGRDVERQKEKLEREVQELRAAVKKWKRKASEEGSKYLSTGCTLPSPCLHETRALSTRACSCGSPYQVSEMRDLSVMMQDSLERMRGKSKQSRLSHSSTRSDDR